MTTVGRVLPSMSEILGQVCDRYERRESRHRPLADAVLICLRSGERAHEAPGKNVMTFWDSPAELAAAYAELVEDGLCGPGCVSRHVLVWEDDRGVTVLPGPHDRPTRPALAVDLAGLYPRPVVEGIPPAKFWPAPEDLNGDRRLPAPRRRIPPARPAGAGVLTASVARSTLAVPGGTGTLAADAAPAAAAWLPGHGTLRATATGVTHPPGFALICWTEHSGALTASWTFHATAQAATAAAQLLTGVVWSVVNIDARAPGRRFDSNRLDAAILAARRREAETGLSGAAPRPPSTNTNPGFSAVTGPARRSEPLSEHQCASPANENRCSAVPADWH